MNHKHPKLPALLLAIVMSTLGMLPNAAWSERGPIQRSATVAAENSVQARVIVKYKADSRLMRSLSAGAGAGGSVGDRPRHAAVLSQRLRVPLSDGWVLGRRTQSLRGSGLSSVQLAEQLAAQPDVEWAVPDQRRYITALPNDPLLADNQLPPTTPAAGQWYLRAPNATLVSAINAVSAWDLSPGLATTTVAVLDTGILSAHPDLAGKLQPGYDFVHDPITANDGGGGRDASPEDPGDWTNLGDCSPSAPAQASSWHGTQVAGLAGAATNNGTGMASVGHNVMLLPVRVLGRCGGYDSDIIAAMRWASGVSSDVGYGAPVTLVNAHPAKVINLSLGSTGACPASYRDVVAELNAAGVSVVAAAGNAIGLAVDAPANCAGVIAVAGIRHVGTKVGYSSVGPEVAIAAPAGNCVNTNGSCLYPLLTTSNTGTTSPLTSASDYIYTGSGANASLGTSFSAPLVAGTVGLMLSVNPGLTPSGIKAILQASARAFPTSGGEVGAPVCHAPNGVDQIECYCTTSTCGAGMLNSAAAVARVFDPNVVIAASTTNPTAGTAVVLDGSGSVVYGGHTIVSYQWTITSGAANASFAGATNAASAILSTTAPGSVTVQLSVTDNSGATATATTSISIAAAPAVGIAAAPAATSSGGGALGWGWMSGLVAVAAALRLSRRRPHQAD